MSKTTRTKTVENPLVTAFGKKFDFILQKTGVRLGKMSLCSLQSMSSAESQVGPEDLRELSRVFREAADKLDKC